MSTKMRTEFNGSRDDHSYDQQDCWGTSVLSPEHKIRALKLKGTLKNIVRYKNLLPSESRILSNLQPSIIIMFIFAII